MFLFDLTLLLNSDPLYSTKPDTPHSISTPQGSRKDVDIQEVLKQSLSLYNQEQYTQSLKKIHRIHQSYKAEEENWSRKEWLILVLSLHYGSLCFYALHNLQHCIKYNCYLLRLLNQYLTHLRKHHQPNHFRLRELYISVLVLQAGLFLEFQMYERAYENASLAYDELLELFRLLNLQYPHEIINFQHSTTKDIYFCQIVLKRAMPVIQQLGCYPSYVDGDSLTEVKKSLLSWKVNKQHFFLPQYDRRNILGLKCTEQHPNNERTFQDIMQLGPVVYEELSKMDDLVYEICERCLTRKLEYLCVSLYFIGVSCWGCKPIGCCFMPFSNHSKNQKAEHYHLLGIHTTMKHLPAHQKLLQQMMQTYHQHYNNQVIPIPEQNTVVSSAGLSPLQPTQKMQKQKTSSSDQETTKCIKRSVTNRNTTDCVKQKQKKCQKGHSSQHSSQHRSKTKRHRTVQEKNRGQRVQSKRPFFK